MKAQRGFLVHVQLDDAHHLLAAIDHAARVVDGAHRVGQRILDTYCSGTPELHCPHHCLPCSHPHRMPTAVKLIGGRPALAQSREGDLDEFDARRVRNARDHAIAAQCLAHRLRCAHRPKQRFDAVTAARFVRGPGRHRPRRATTQHQRPGTSVGAHARPRAASRAANGGTRPAPSIGWRALLGC